MNGFVLGSFMRYFTFFNCAEVFTMRKTAFPTRANKIQAVGVTLYKGSKWMDSHALALIFGVHMTPKLF